MKQMPIIDASLSVISSKGNISIQFSRRTNDLNLIKCLVDSALKDLPVLVSLSYKNKLLFINSLVNAGIITFDPKNKEYSFNF